MRAAVLNTLLFLWYFLRLLFFSCVIFLNACAHPFAAFQQLKRKGVKKTILCLCVHSVKVLAKLLYVCRKWHLRGMDVQRHREPFAVVKFKRIK